MPNQFCTHCGAPLVRAARYCVECGAALSGAAPRAATSLPWQRYAPVVVVASVLIVGAAAVLLGTQSAKEPPRVPPRNVAPQRVEDKLPQGHPAVELPDTARDILRKKAEEVSAHPEDINARKQLGLMQYRAGLIDPTYLKQAVQTYEAILSRDPKDLDALRALGDISSDGEQQQKALEYYTRFLALKPDDPYVLTLVGNLQLSARNGADAVKSYAAALQIDPMLFQAQVGLGFGYAATGEPAKALEALQRARGLATDDATRKQVDDILARVGAAPGGAAPAAAAAPAGAGGGGGAAAGDGGYRSGVEAVFRAHPIVGPKLDRIEWSDDQKLKVILREFPMDQMPPFARDKFTDRIKTGVRENKEKYGIGGSVTVELVDSASGRVMDTVTQ
jgi:tetratricopeptide (TPR) repeat protein